MKRILTVLLISCFLVILFAPLASADTWVNGYFRSNGTYVQGHWRSDPDGSFYNNYSYKYNTNPYTGRQGTKSYSPLYKSYSSYYDGSYSTPYRSNLYYYSPYSSYSTYYYNW